MKAFLMMSAVVSVAMLWASPESDLEAKLPAIFKASAAHYGKLEAASEAAQPKPWVDTNGVEQVGRPRFPGHFEDGKIDYIEDTCWTSGFFPGSLWYLYEATGEAKWRAAAEKWTDRLVGIKDYVDNHDIGFMMYCSAGNALRLTGNQKYEGWLHSAAKCLRERFNEKTGTIKSWNSFGENFIYFGMHHITIIDNLMNLELLLWDSRYTYTVDGAWWSGQVALKHADTTLEHHFRADGSAYHILDYDPENGVVLGIRAGQGARVEGTWARGQAWAVYGYTMMYRETGYARYLEQAIKASDYVMDAPTPADGIPYWDYKAPGIPNEPRDSSAAAILASAFMELSQYAPPEKAKRYRAWAVKALNTLAGEGYFAKPGENGEFLLKHGTGCKPFGVQVDTPLNYADYYFLEALLRFRKLKAREAEFAAVAKTLPEKAALPKDEFFLRADLSNCDSVHGIDIPAVAEATLTDPIPATTDELYGEFFVDGNRSRYEHVYFIKTQRLLAMVWQEAKERKGRYLRRIDEYLRDICAMKSWVLPAHDWADGGKLTFRGIAINTDLFSTQIGANLACILQEIGDRLEPETVRLVRENIERRVLAPVRRELTARIFPETAIGIGPSGWNGERFWFLGWMRGHANWNAVCWDNAVTAACAMLDDPVERAQFIVAADRAAEDYLEYGFAADGYCSEGMGYWNYGYGHHLLTGRMVKELTKGGFDFMRRPKDRLAAAYGRAYTMTKGVSPAFADGTGAVDGRLLKIVDGFWPDLPKEMPAVSEFPEGQVWLIRDPEGFSVAFKGGNNEEHHNHNDLGSYYIVAGDRFVAGDPGREVYTRRTFSAERYESQVLNSYGHPVPVIGGKLQSEGTNYFARVVEKKVKVKGEGEQWSVDSLERAKGDEVYEVVLDLTAAYDVKTLKQLTRTFVYDRGAKTFTVTDHACFSEPTSFEDCYVTFGEQVNVAVKALKGGKVVMKETTIDNPDCPTPHRFGYAFEKPVTEAEIEFVFRAEM